MSKYVKADELILELQIKANEIVAPDNLDEYASGYWAGLTFAKHTVEDTPAADVEPVRHGKWIKTDTDFHDMPMEEFKCSVCGNTAHNLTDTTIPLPKFCDGCGAKMDGGSTNETD